MFKCEYMSPLKVIISGEHSVVYSKNALAAAFDKYYECFLWEDNNEESKVLFDLFLFNEKDSLKMVILKLLLNFLFYESA
jgi:mevalonate kinase